MRPFRYVLAGLALFLLAACQPSGAAQGTWHTATPFQPASTTPTPFLPAHPTLTPVATQPDELNFQFHGIDFSTGAGEIMLTFWPASQSLNHGDPIEVPVLPAATCVFGDHQACVYHYRTPHNGEVIWVSVHSGVGGEGQRLRHALEGTGINSTGLDLPQIGQNLENLPEAGMSLIQGEVAATAVSVVAAARVPAYQLADYLALPIDGALEFALENDSTAWQQVQSDRTTLVIETCGWRLAGEAGAEWVTDTSASIYLVILQ